MGIPRFETITTDRILIRPMQPSDAEPLWKRRDDPTTARYQNWTLPYPRERARELVDSMMALDGIPPENGWMQLAVDDAATGEPLGDLAVGFTFDGRSAEIGYTLGAAARGRGIATEAAERLVSWLFDTVGVTRVAATMHPDNLASVRVAEHLGLVFEGHTRNSCWVGDENSDDWIFGATPEAWRAWIDRRRTAPDRVELVEISNDNIGAVEKLATHHSQTRFVSPMAMSFADALFPESSAGRPVVPWYRGVAADGELVGFVMTVEPTADKPSVYLWRLLIDRLHQRRGIGSRVLDLMIDRARSMGAAAMELSYVEGPGSPEPLYTGKGFVVTGEIEDGETVARLEL